MRQISFQQHRLALFTAGLVFLLLLSACGSTTSGSPTPTPAPKGTVSVAYAASLSNIFEKVMKPAFDQSTGYTYQGEAKGSSALVNEIKGRLSFPDVFISANPKLNAQLMGTANGNYASWYLDFARTEMVIGYNSNSKFAADFQAAANGTKQWYQVLEVSRLGAGQLDAGFFYINEVKGPNIPYISLPDQVNLGKATIASQYATATWTNPKTN